MKPFASLGGTATLCFCVILSACGRQPTAFTQNGSAVVPAGTVAETGGGMEEQDTSTRSVSQGSNEASAIGSSDGSASSEYSAPAVSPEQEVASLEPSTGELPPRDPPAVSDAVVVPQPEPVPTAAPQPVPTAKPQPVFVPTPENSSVVCTRSGQQSFDATVAKHQDAEAGARDRYGFGSSIPASDVASSGVVRLGLADIEGNVLPVSSFDLDDIAIIVKEGDSIGDVLEADLIGKTRTIKIPAHAMMIYDGNNTNFASGSVDSGSTTIYQFQSSAVTLAGGTSISLKQVYEMGVPLIAHNKVSISELRDRGFVNASNQIAFKVFHVAHGWGLVTLKFTVSPCR